MIFALVLGCLAAWILVAEFSRPFYPGFSATTQPDTVANRNSAASAASLGIIRGDLWAEYALSYFDALQGDANVHDLDVEQARKAAERAVALAPHDARVWLFLASIDSRFDWLNSRTAAALRMSYYTGANETELMPLRLLLAVDSQALSNKDFRELVRHDIRTIVSRKPELNPSILAAYREALPSGRQFIEETLDQIDPGLLAKLRFKE